MDESGSPWPGHNVKVQVNSNNEQYLKIESNSNTSSTGDVTIPSNVKNVKIVRINHILYYSFDNKNLVKLNDFTGFTDYFDVPLTFGGALDGNNQPIRYFDGDLANIYVSFLNDNITVMKYNEINNNVTLAYQHIEPIVFDGTNNINTNLKLFNKENATLDFELSFNIDKFGTGFETQSTLVNGKLESGGYPGFVYRFTSDGKKLEFTAKGGTEKSRASTNISKINHVSIIRKDEKMYVNINSGNEILVYDFTNFTDYHDMPLIISYDLVLIHHTFFQNMIMVLL